MSLLQNVASLEKQGEIMLRGCIHRQASPQTPQGFHTCFLSPLFPMSWIFEQATKLQIDYPCFLW